MFSILKG